MAPDAQDGGVAGVLVAEVTPDGPAAAAGLMQGDVVRQFNGEAVDSTRTLARLVGTRDAGEEVELEVLRGGSSRTVTVELGELDEARLQAAAPAKKPLRPAPPDEEFFFRR
jgi:serine protease Do